MKKWKLCLLFCGAMLLALSTPGLAAEEAVTAQEKPKVQSTRAKALFGAPVNVNIAGGGSLPKGTALTMINTSLANKQRSERGYAGSDIFSQVWLLKMRYGITNHLEIATTLPYINNDRDTQAVGPKHIEGFADQVVQFTFAPWNQHQGDSFSAGLTAGVLIPTGTWGKNHVPGVGVWGGRLAAGIGKFVTRNIKLDTELVWSGAFERGNQKVKRGDQFQWNTNMRYLFDYVDFGIESTLVYQDSGDKKLPDGSTMGLRNGYTEWFIGPSMNVAIAPLDMWVGVGMFFPVLQDVKGPAVLEDVRFEFKVGKVW